MAMTRKEKYNLIKSATGDSQLARRARDWGAERIRRQLGLSVPVRESKPQRQPQKQPERVQKEVRQAKAREQYHEARRLGYTPEEAARMRYWSRECFRNTVQKNEVVIESSRHNKWVYMAKRGSFYDYLKHEANRINKELGLDKNAKPGWGAVYYWYTRGGYVKEWQNKMADALDPFIPEQYIAPL